MSREIKRVNDLRECSGNGLDVNKQREDPITRNPLGYRYNSIDKNRPLLLQY
jgi:hypothetical protein